MKKPEELRFQQKAREVWDRKLTKDAIYINYDLMTNYRLKMQRLGTCSLCLFIHICLFVSEKAMATHSSTLAWKIPWMEEPGRLQSMGS